MYKAVLFDLDGTITDSEQAITKSVRYALEKYGIQETDQEKLKKFIGPPLADSFRDYYGFTEERALEAIQFYREYYNAGGKFQCPLYDGVEDLLRNLKDQGLEIALATSKPEIYAAQILEYHHLDGYFDFIGGATLNERDRITKEDVIGYVLDHLKVKDHDKILMVGDREHDIIGANAFQLDSVGVLYGFGDLEELEKAGATYICSRAIDIEEIVMK